MQKLVYENNTEVCHITINELICEELEHATDDYISVLKQITNLNVSLACSGAHMLDAKREGLNDVLTSLNKFGFKLAVIWAEGAWPTDDLDSDLLACAKEWNMGPKWMAAGHILVRKNKPYPQFHNQCIVINLAECGKGDDGFVLNSTGDANNWTANNWTMSEEHLHDDYTPVWVDGKIEKIQHDEITRNIDNKNVFDMAMRAALNNETRIHNLPFNIRNKKECCYPEDDIKWAETSIFKDLDMMDEEDRLDWLYDIADNYPDKKSLFEFKVMREQVLYITNTESVPSILDQQLQVIVCPCSGLHQFKYIANNIDTMEKVLWTDFSPYAVAWTKIVVNEWNGLDYDSFYNANFSRINYNGGIIYSKPMVDKFINSFSSTEEWLEIWNKIKDLEHCYHNFNLINEWKKVIPLIGQHKNVMLQCSNIYAYEANYLNKGIVTTQAVIEYITEALGVSNKVILNGDANGTFYDRVNIGRRKWV